jgi:hypothetical protein
MVVQPERRAEMKVIPAQGSYRQLVISMSTARVLLLVNYRPEYQHTWGSKTYYSQLRMNPLLPESAGVLLRANADRPAASAKNS